MVEGSRLADFIITGAVLFAIFILAYCRITHKTLIDFFNEIREIFSSKYEEVSPNELGF